MYIECDVSVVLQEKMNGSQYYSAALIRNIIALQQDIWWGGVFNFLYLHLFNINHEHTRLHFDQTAQVRLVCSKRQTPIVTLIVQWHLLSRPLYQEVIKISH